MKKLVFILMMALVFNACTTPTPHVETSTGSDSTTQLVDSVGKKDSTVVVDTSTQVKN